jgi:hypothetical protein
MDFEASKTENVDVHKILLHILDAKKFGNWKEMNSSQTRKRLRWYEANLDKLDLQGSDVRKAYQLLLLEYLKISPEQVPIVEESDTKIVWHSYNECPVISACKRGGFDTREVCSNAYEASVQHLIQKINPSLVFSRNYQKIRPYSEYCEEMITLQA